MDKGYKIKTPTFDVSQNSPFKEEFILIIDFLKNSFDNENEPVQSSVFKMV